MTKSEIANKIIDRCLQITSEEDKRLTVKQQKFCDYYLQTGNATESAKKSGYSDKTAAVIGCEMLKKPNIKKYIEEEREKLHKENVATTDEILRFWSDILRCEEMPVNFRLKASEFLGKRFNLFDGTGDKAEESKKRLEQIVNAINGVRQQEDN